MEENFLIKLQAMLDIAKSKKQVNSDIKALEEVVRNLRLTATLAKGTSKQKLNQGVRQLERQLNQVKLKAKLDQRNLKADINKALSDVSFKDIDLNIDSGKTKLKVKKVIADVKKTVQSSPISVNVDLKKQKLNNQLTTYLTRNSKITESKALLQEVEQLRGKIASINDRTSLRDATDSFQLFKSEVAATGFQTKATAEKVKGLISRFTKIGSAVGIASTAINRFQQSLQTIKINDTIITEVSKTSNATQRELKELGDTAFETASKFGQMSSDYLEAVKEMNRSGFYGEAGKALGELSLKTQAAGDISVDVAQKYLLATSAAYDYKGSVEQLTAVLDGQNAITNTFSVDMETMASATTKAGSVAANTGVKIEELSAMVGTISARTKEAGEKTGTGIKSLLVNLQNISSDKIVDTLNKANASMTETVNGVEKLRNPMDILKDLAKTYNALDESDPLKSEITTNIGQKYHANQLSSLLSGWDEYEKMLKTYSDGMGSAEIEAQKTADSLQGRINALQNSWDSLVNTIVNKDALNSGISLFDGLINSAEKLLDTFDLIPVAMAGITAGMTAFRKDYGITQIFNQDTGKLDIEGNLFGINFSQIKHFKEAEKAIANYNERLSNGITDIDTFKNKTVQNTAQLREYLKTCSVDAPASLKGYKQHLQDAGEATGSLRLGTTLLSTAISFGAGMLIDTAFKGLDYLINYEEKQKEAFEKAKAATKEVANSIRDLKSEMSDTSSKASELSSEFAKLVQGVDPLTNKNKTLSTDEYQKFLDVNKQLAEIFPSLTHNYDENGNAILGLSGDVDTVTASIQRLVEQQNNLAKADIRKHLDEYVNGTDDSEGAFKALEGSKKEVDDAEKDLKDLETTYNNIINKKGSKRLFNEKQYNEYLDYIENKFGEDARNLVDSISKKRVQDKGSAIYDIDFSKLKLDETTKGKITESYNTFYQDLQTTLSVKQSELEVKNQEMSDTMMVWVEDLDFYKNSDPAFQKAISSMVGSIKWSDMDVDEGNIDEAKQIVQQLVLNPLYSACKDPNKKLEVINALNNLFTLDFSKLNYKEASEKIKAFLSVIMKAVNDGLPKEQQKSLSDMYDMFGLGDYKDASDKMGNSLSSIAQKGSSDYKKLETYTDGFTQKQVEAWLTATNGAKSADEAIQNYENSLKSSSDAKKKSFKEVWDSIGKSGDEEADKKALEAKEKLEELAEAGKLTEKELKKSSLAKVFTDAGVSIEKATKEINKFKSSAGQLASMKTGISSISSILGEKKENLSSKKTRNDGIGAETLAGMPDDVKAQTKEYEHFVEVLGNGTSKMKDCKAAANELATAYVNSNNFLSKLTPKTVDYYTSVLKEMGVENASEVVKNALAKQTYALRLEKLANSNATKEEIAALQEEAGQYGITSAELANYVLQKKITNNNALDTSKSINNLIDLAKQCGATSKVIVALQNLLKSTSELESLYQKDLTEFSSNAAADVQHAPDAAANEKSEEIGKASTKVSSDKKKLQKLIRDATKIGASVDVKPTNPSGGTKGKGKKDKSKSTQQIDWISRALDRLSSKLDLVKAKYDNLINNKKAKNSDSLLALQNKNLHEQYELLKKTEKYQTKAQKKYTKKAKSVIISKDKKEDASLKKAVKNGRIKGDMKSLIATYGEKKAKKIQTYQDYYDKAREAEKNRQDTRAKITQNKIDKQQLIQDNADKKIARYQAERENALLKNKNNTIKSQINEIEKSYEAQIKIAQIERDTVTEAKLRAEKQKTLNDLYQEEIDNIKANTDAKIKLLETGSVNNNGTRETYGQQYYKNQVDLIESRGLAVDAYWYQEQNRIERDKIAEKESERADLIRKLSNYQEGSEQWYNLQSDIADCDNSIVESKKVINDNSAAIRNLRNTIETKANERLDSLSSELEFISKLKYGETTDSDKGTFTDTGNLSMYTTAMQIATAQAAKQYNTDNLNTLNQLYEDYKKGYGNSQTWKDAGFDGYFNDDGSLNLDNVEEDLKNYRQLVQDNISAEIQGEQAIIDLMKQKYEAQKSYLQDIIDAKREAMNIEKELYDYERNIADKTKSVANLQKQINALHGDDSEEGRARLAKLQVSLDDAQKDLQDTEYDRYISDQQDMLDNLIKEYEDLITNLMKDTQAILIDGLNYIKQNEGGLGSLLKQVAEERNYPTSTDLLTISDALSSDDYAIHATIKESEEAPISKAIMGMASQTEELNKRLSEKLVGESSLPAQQPKEPIKQPITEELSGIAALNETGSDANKRYGVNQFIRKHGTKPKKKKKDWKEYSDVNYKIVKEFGVVLSTDNLKKLAKQVEVKYDNATKNGNLYKKLKSMNVQGFSRGGIGRLLKRKGEDGFAMFRDGEGFVRPEDVPPVRDFVKTAPKLNDLVQPLLDLPKMPEITPTVPTSTTTVSDVHFSFSLPNVKDSKTLLSEIQTDPKIQKALQEISLGQTSGKNKLTVNRIR